MTNKSWREIHKQWIEENNKGSGWAVMGLIGLSGLVVYGFGFLPVPSLFAWFF